MSTASVTSPIQLLNFDVLWRIFDMNANIFDDEMALKTTLATSRVCHDWRVFLLNSTSIWAHVMDLDDQLWNSVEGSREIIHRSGTASLWLKVNHLDGYHPPARGMKRVVNFVHTIWERIQKLDVHIIRHIHGTVDPWKLLRRPSPNLESFSLDFNNYNSQPNELRHLFGGSAPMLRDFRLAGNRCNFGTLSWLQQLHSMQLTGNLPVPEILSVLMSTTNLTRLNLHLYHAADKTAANLPLVLLPKLTHLDLIIKYFKLTPSVVLMEKICIPPSCVVTLVTSQILRGEFEKANTFGPIIGTIVSCARHCFENRLPGRLQVIITPSTFIFKATNHFDEPSFIFHLELHRSHSFPGRALSTFLREFSLPSLSKITFFTIRITAVLYEIQGLATLIAHLPSVETIATEKFSLRYFRACAPRKGRGTETIAFPALKTLRLGSFTPPPELRCRFDKVPDPISKYVMARSACGQAISVIEFTEDTFDALPNMEFLRKANATKVLWRQSDVSEIQEYICGASASEKPVAVLIAADSNLGRSLYTQGL